MLGIVYAVRATIEGETFYLRKRPMSGYTESIRLDFGVVPRLFYKRSAAERSLDYCINRYDSDFDFQVVEVYLSTEKPKVRIAASTREAA